MSQMSCRVVMVLAVLLLAVSAAAAPVKVSDINQMIRDGKTPAEIIAVMREEGVDIRMTKTVERRLESWDFTEEQIQTVTRIINGEDVGGDEPSDDDDEKPDAQPEVMPDQPNRQAPPQNPFNRPVFQPGAPDEAPGAPAGPGLGQPGEQFGVGYAMPDEFHAQEKARVERAIAAANLGYKRHELSRVTLYCNDRRARRLVPMLQELEQKLIRMFPKSLVNACSPYSAHIVIVDGDSEWSNWVDACFASYEKDGINFKFGPEGDTKTVLKRGNGYMLPFLAAVHADKLRNDEMVARFACYDVGHLIMTPAGGAKAPDTLVTGFGDFTEALMFGNPSVTVYSYLEREGEAAQDWLQLIQQRFRNGDIKSAHAVWGYTTDAMRLFQYAEAWSLVTTLAQAPDKFAAAVLLVQQGKSMPEAVEEVYGLDERKLLEAWFRFTSR